LRDEVKKIGGKAYKFVSPGNNGVPDRLVCFPLGQARFVETKSPGKKLTPLQAKRKRELEMLGFSVSVIDSKEKVDLFIKEFGLL
jgi:hypothetical protein